MSIERLQSAIRERKTPVALGLAPEIGKISAKLLKNFEDMFGPGAMANAETLRYHACQTMDAAQGKLTMVSLYGVEGARVRVMQEMDRALSALSSFGPEADFFRELIRSMVNRSM